MANHVTIEVELRMGRFNKFCCIVVCLFAIVTGRQIDFPKWLVNRIAKVK